MPYNVKPKIHSCLRNGKVNDLIFSVTLRSAQTKANKELSKNKASCNNSEGLLYSNLVVLAIKLTTLACHIQICIR